MTATYRPRHRGDTSGVGAYDAQEHTQYLVCGHCGRERPAARMRAWVETGAGGAFLAVVCQSTTTCNDIARRTGRDACHKAPAQVLVSRAQTRLHGGPHHECTPECSWWGLDEEVVF